MSNVIYLDFDGVIRVMPDGKNNNIKDFIFCQNRMNILSYMCSVFDYKIVLSTDWRSHSNVYQFIEPLVEHLHECDKTPILGQRWEEIESHIINNNVDKYVILDDCPEYFEDCPKEMMVNLIVCDHINGLTLKTFDELLDNILNKG